MKNIIEIKNITKEFQHKKGIVKALDNVSFEIKEGEIFGFLGENGAGKSTLISILTSFSRPTFGSATISGFDVVKKGLDARKEFGIVFQGESIDQDLSVEYNLWFQAKLYGINKEEIPNRINEVLKIIGLEKYRTSRVGQLSGGQRRRIELARSLICNPKILFLDEPTTGLDPESRENIWKILNNINKTKGTTIFLTTHYLEETEICNRLGIIADGKLITIDTIDSLKEKYSQDSLIMDLKDEREKEILLKKIENLKVKIENKKLIITTENLKTSTIIKISQVLNRDIDEFKIKQGRVQDVFLNILKEVKQNDRN